MGGGGDKNRAVVPVWPVSGKGAGGPAADKL